MRVSMCLLAWLHVTLHGLQTGQNTPYMVQLLSGDSVVYDFAAVMPTGLPGCICLLHMTRCCTTSLQQQDSHVRYGSVQAMFGMMQNHCCAPSMYTKVLEVEGESRLVFFARTDIKPGQELTYDYR